jgi:hypothetical protein
VSFKVLDYESGDSGQVKQDNLLIVDYDPVGKGNDIDVTTGIDKVDYSHTIEVPVAGLQTQHESGEVASLEIIDQNKLKTIFSF